MVLYSELLFGNPLSPDDSVAIVVLALTVQSQAYQPLLLVRQIWHQWTVD